MHGLEPASDSRTVVRIPSRLVCVAFVAIAIWGGACGVDDSNTMGKAGGQNGPAGTTTGPQGQGTGGSPGSPGGAVGSGGSPAAGSGDGLPGISGGAAAPDAGMAVADGGTTVGSGGNPAGDAGTPGTGGAVGGTGGAGVAVPVGPNPDLATRMRCTGTDPISCHFGGSPGNYDVTVVLGGAQAGMTLVSAETHRVMLPAVQTAAGQTRRFTFTVNVRQPEGEPIQAVPAGTPGLDLYFTGAGGVAPQLQSIGFAAAANPFGIYIAGDSTVCDQFGIAFGGWGQALPQHFDFPVVVVNYADSGESSGSFLGSANLFGAITSRLKANDWVLIQFGHNDKTVSATTFHDNMTRLVAGVRAKGAFPVLVTPVARAQFNGNTVSAQHINGTGANLPQIVKQVGTEQNAPVLDLTARTVTWLTQLGPTGWQAFHANGTDVTHTNPAGAAVEAGFVRELIQQANLTALVNHLR